MFGYASPFCDFVLIYGAPFVFLGVSWGFWEVLGDPLGVLGVDWQFLGVLGGPLGGSMGCLGARGFLLGTSWGSVWCPWGPWKFLLLSLGDPRGASGIHREALERFVEVSGPWGQPCGDQS